ncbi:uncharacterized protein LOC107792138 [Nicotiana tabacum]|uniref:Uncharacterized protein LOC107792138 n=1 Tax=Nicotiana tabacum TaxID=4097 RepID=A0AC58TZ46_TOBAC|nr:uncharacterized protein LOC104095311 [Nicotiana tomentosiformis]XP_018625915.1 uncharacterized protein LOC104095311 [Nicotiana tomentosiformis]
MKKRSRSTRKSSAADFLSTPPATSAASPVQSMSESPKPFVFNFNTFNATPTSSSKKKLRTTGKKSFNISSPEQLKPAGSPASVKNLKSIADLKEFASSQLDSVKRQIERSHMEILKDLEASQSRLQKRLKIQTQGCQQVADEAEREYKKMSERINEGRDAMKASYSTFMAELQASGARLCKQTIPELSQSAEKAIDTLKNRYGIHSTSAC